MPKTYAASDFFTLDEFQHRALFEGTENAWNALGANLKAYIAAEIKPGSRGTIMDGAVVEDNVQIGEGSVIEPGAFVKGPTIIGNNCEIRHGAYIRGNTLVGNKCVVGHTTEVKGSVFLDGSKAGHFAYVGDSILGNGVNLGAGTKLANFKLTGDEISILLDGARAGTGMRKLGAILGDGCQTGCNSVTSPGTLLGRKTFVYPCMSIRAGHYPDSSRLR